MKLYTIFLVSTLISISLFSQTVNKPIDYAILKTDLQPGLIRTFSDFQKGKITKVSGELFLTENSEVWQKIIGKVMKLALRDSVTQKVSPIKDRVWGFCDGQNIYIRDDAQYCQLTIGRYCYYKKTSLYIVYFIPIVSEKLRFFAIRNGRVFEAISLLEILKQYPDLRNEYRKDTDYKDKDVRYLQKLNAIN